MKAPNYTKIPGLQVNSDESAEQSLLVQDDTAQNQPKPHP